MHEDDPRSFPQRLEPLLQIAAARRRRVGVHARSDEDAIGRSKLPLTIDHRAR